MRRRRTLARKRLRRGGAVPLGASAGRSWERSRYTAPYLRDELMNLGAIVETLETAHTWAASTSSTEPSAPPFALHWARRRS